MRIVFTIIFIILSLPIQAQDAKKFDERKLHIGFKLGIGTAGIGNFDFEGKDQIKGLTKKIMASYTIGLVYEYKLRARIHLRGEINYIAKGGGYEAPNNSVVIISNQGTDYGKNYYQYKLDYCEFPLIVKALLSNEVSYPYISGGLAPSVYLGGSFQTNSWTKSNNFGVHPTSSINRDVTAYARGFDLPVLLGLGYDKHVSRGFIISIEMRYSYGIIKTFATGNNHNSVFLLNLGLLF